MPGDHSPDTVEMAKMLALLGRNADFNHPGIHNATLIADIRHIDSISDSRTRHLAGMNPGDTRVDHRVDHRNLFGFGLAGLTAKTKWPPADRRFTP